WARRQDSSLLAGWRSDEVAPLTELRLRPAPDGPLATRLDAEILLRDRLLLGGPPPEGAEVLAAVPWRYAELAAVFRRRLGAGSLLADPAVDLVVVGVPPALHATAVLECLAAGKHVVCEKPFALRADEADRMMAAAADAGRTVTVYQSRRWDPDFVALRDAVLDGGIGDPFYLEAFIGGYGHPCSYWHSHEPISGGSIFDWGSHYFDWMLQLLPGRVTGVSA